MKILFLFISLYQFFPIPVIAQKTDTIIIASNYKSYFSYSLKEPLYVTYTLDKGGGACDRIAESFSFKNENDPHFAKGRDYNSSGYEKGHLANAEDFAYNCDLEEETFHYYNCLPQTVKLNKGIWKTWETTIRTLSQSKKIFVIAGGIYGKKTIGAGKIGVPAECYKIVLDSKTKKIIYCLIFKNDNSNKVRSIGLAALKKKMKYPLVP